MLGYSNCFPRFNPFMLSNVSLCFSKESNTASLCHISRASILNVPVSNFHITPPYCCPQRYHHQRSADFRKQPSSNTHAVLCSACKGMKGVVYIMAQWGRIKEAASTTLYCRYGATLYLLHPYKKWIKRKTAHTDEIISCLSFLQNILRKNNMMDFDSTWCESSVTF